MSDYVLINGELYHYGIKGQKWGVRRYQNKDGSLTRAGKKRAIKKFARDYRKTTFRNGDDWSAKAKLASSEKIQELHNSRILKDARKKFEDLANVEKDYWNNKKTVDKYQRKAAEEVAKKYGMSYKDVLEGFKYDDLDQGDGGSFALYLRDKGSSYHNFERQVASAKNEYKEACKQVADSVLEDYGKTVVVKADPTSIFGSSYTTVSNVVAETLNMLTSYESLFETDDD